MRPNSHRGTIFLEEGEILQRTAYEGEQYLLRLRAPACAKAARPGQFIHLRCQEALPLRRPLSILRAQADWIELLFRAVGRGTRALARQPVGAQLSLLGPIGQPFRLPSSEKPVFLVGGGVGIPPLIFAAQCLHRQNHGRVFAAFGSEIPFPFAPKPAEFLVPGLPPDVIAAMPLLEDWGIPNRLASQQGYPGCFSGYVTDLARRWLQSLEPTAAAQTEILACGPQPMLAAAAGLARAFGCACQVSLEAFMACGVGGCAGCVVDVHTAHGLARKRVCVDGPVFDALQIF